jgi:hypothetical protein
LLLGVFFAVSGSFFLILFGVGWREITVQGLEGAFMPWIVISAFCLFFGTFTILQNMKRLKRISLKEQGVTEGEWQTPSLKKEQRSSDVERFAFFLALICLNFALGFLRNNIGFYVFGIGFILLVVNEVLARTSKRYKDSVGRVAHKIIGVTVAAFATIYYAFVNVNLLVASIGFTIITAYFGFLLFTRYRKKIRSISPDTIPIAP